MDPLLTYPLNLTGSHYATVDVEVEVATMNISLPDEMRHWIESQVASGRYAKASDYISDLLRTNQVTTGIIRLALIKREQSEVVTGGTAR